MTYLGKEIAQPAQGGIFNCVNNSIVLKQKCRENPR
jgi:hypothetical protein